MCMQAEDHHFKHSVKTELFV